jgi:ABC-type glycerol-3-phosphate transport system permease component
MQLPEDMLDAARVDGAGELRILTRIVLPLSKPAVLTAALITFIGPWNEFLWPFLVTKKAEMQPLALALANYISAVAATTAVADASTSITVWPTPVLAPRALGCRPSNVRVCSDPVR